MPRVFLTYAHDSKKHKDDVRRLGNLLVESGIDVDLDQWAEGVPRDWSVWALQSTRAADYVIVVASPRYAAAADGLGPATVNRGARSEAATLRNLLHGDRDLWTTKLLPVVLPGHSVSDLPYFVLPHIVDHYVIEELSSPGLEGLIRVITRQPRYTKPTLGAIPHFPAESDSGENNPGTTTTAHRSVEDYVGEASPICLRIRAGIAEAEKKTLEDVAAGALSEKAAEARKLLRFHDVMDEGWRQLSEVRLPSGDDDRSRLLQAWQETYLRIQMSLGTTAKYFDGIVRKPGVLSFLVRPIAGLTAGVETLNLTKEFRRLSKLLGIENPLEG
ncbi:toll/interleukin-1 receptor domain-containing protein [Actinokineospora sp. UTMC 2448]|uniref:toll/interleukin-1 receptor domain-containing protein n=1 Tax=Actinokineospora sp. UTMC 2448 TaxID=2268449 RepID=UPI002164D549|nr:toll/interleukin-1 receptor domain-containing protein [Actinokineospora sp. UTMC 2448]UVS79463.1 SEFIR domain protein [Actinokineospora sp. UTMC 2448]